MGRKFFVGGNWKMNGDKASIDTIIAFLKAGPLDPNTGRLSFLFHLIFRVAYIIVMKLTCNAMNRRLRHVILFQ